MINNKFSKLDIPSPPHRRNEKLKYITVNHGYVLPWKFKDGTLGVGGVLDNEKNYLPISSYPGWLPFGGSYKFNESISSEQKVIWFGNYLEHWGHFLLDDLSRLWVCEHVSKDYKIAYVSKGKEFSSNEMRFFELLGVEKNRLLRVDKVTSFKEIIIPELSKTPEYYTKEYEAIFRKVVNKAYELKSTSGDIKKNIYFTRGGFKAANNKEYGEEKIEKLFKDNNFEVISPEKLSLDEQIYLWNSAGNIVSLNGTIPLNVMFCYKKNLNVIILNKTKIIHKNAYDLIYIKEHYNNFFVDVFSDKFANAPKYLGQGPFIMSVTNNLECFLSEIFSIEIRGNDNHLFRYCFYYKYKSLSAIKEFAKFIINFVKR